MLKSQTSRFVDPIAFCFAFLLLKCGTVSALLVVVDKGLRPLKKDDIGLVMFVSLENKSKSAVYSVAISPAACCLNITPTDVDCDTMQVLKSESADIHPGTRQQIFLVYPTLYTHDRRGTCFLELSTSSATLTDDAETSHVRINFDTTLRNGADTERLLHDYPANGWARKCKYVDENPLRGCVPADCDIKYDGYRPYFHRESRRCLATPTCLSADKDFPETAYVPTANVCRDLRLPITPRDIEILNSLSSFNAGIEMENASAKAYNSKVHRSTTLWGKLRKRNTNNDYFYRPKKDICHYVHYSILSSMIFITLLVVCYIMLRICENLQGKRKPSSALLPLYLLLCGHKEESDDSSVTSIVTESQTRQSNYSNSEVMNLIKEIYIANDLDESQVKMLTEIITKTDRNSTIAAGDVNAATNHHHDTNVLTAQIDDDDLDEDNIDRKVNFMEIISKFRNNDFNVTPSIASFLEADDISGADSNAANDSRNTTVVDMVDASTWADSKFNLIDEN